MPVSPPVAMATGLGVYIYNTGLVVMGCCAVAMVTVRVMSVNVR